MNRQAFSLSDLEEMQYIPASIQYAGIRESSPEYYASRLQSESEAYRKRMEDRQSKQTPTSVMYGDLMPSGSDWRNLNRFRNIQSELTPSQKEEISRGLALRGLGRSRIGSKIKKDVVMSNINPTIDSLNISPEQKEEIKRQIRARIAGDSLFAGTLAEEYRPFQPWRGMITAAGEESPIAKFGGSYAGFNSDINKRYIDMVNRSRARQ